MGTRATGRPVAPRASPAPAHPALALALADLRAYQHTLRGRGDLLQARAVAHCIDLLRRRARHGAPN